MIGITPRYQMHIFFIILFLSPWVGWLDWPWVRHWTSQKWDVTSSTLTVPLGLCTVINADGPPGLPSMNHGEYLEGLCEFNNIYIKLQCWWSTWFTIYESWEYLEGLCEFNNIYLNNLNIVDCIVTCIVLLLLVNQKLKLYIKLEQVQRVFPFSKLYMFISIA